MIVDYQIVLTDAAVTELEEQISLWKPKPGPNADIPPGQAPTLPDEVLRAAEFAIKGYWNDPVGGQVLNGICQKTDLDALVIHYATDILEGPWAKVYSSGIIVINYEYNGSHNDQLALQQGTPTFENPNWAHTFNGLLKRKFARSTDMSVDGSTD